jgi:uracil-DNA glycosylase
VTKLAPSRVPWYYRRMNQLRSEIYRDVRALLQQQAKGDRRVVSVSPEVNTLLESIGAPPVLAAAPPCHAVEPSHAVAENADALAALAAEVAGCTKCPLCQRRTQTVFSDGDPSAGIVFVGEAPGRDEDLQGTPFVGRAGQLLTDIIEKGMKLPRGDVYICNILKCRPPNNRDPLPEEVAQCEPYLIRQLELVRPKVICCLGRIAAHTLLRTTEPLGRLRGRWHWYQGIPLRVTYHPAYVLRQQGQASLDTKRQTWMDVLEVLKVYRGELTPQ